MDIDNWSYDFESLPFWGTKYRYPYDLMCENSQLDMAFLIYSIDEFRMGWYGGFLAVFKNKKSPELMLLVDKRIFSNSETVFSGDGKLAFAKSCLWNEGFPILIFDLSAQKFACFKTVTDNISFEVKETERNEFVIVADEWQMEHDASGLLTKLNGTKIETGILDWMPFSDIDSFCAQFEKPHRGPGLFKKIYKLIYSAFCSLFVFNKL